MVGDGKWLTVHELAELVGVSDGTARAWADAGVIVLNGAEHEIHVNRIGRLGHRRINAADVRAALGGREPGAPE